MGDRDDLQEMSGSRWVFKVDILELLNNRPAKVLGTECSLVSKRSIEEALLLRRAEDAAGRSGRDAELGISGEIGQI